MRFVAVYFEFIEGTKNEASFFLFFVMNKQPTFVNHTQNFGQFFGTIWPLSKSKNSKNILK